MADLQPSGTLLPANSDPEFPPSHIQPDYRLAPPPRRPYWLHLLLFLLTVLTTLVVGAGLQNDFANGQPMFIASGNFFPWRWILEQPSRLVLGVPFSASLLGILMAHEMGHFVLSVRNRVYATLPFFIPAPTPIGTFGAFIQIKSMFHTRAALFDIGVAGPIAGFVVAVPVCIVGVALSQPLPPGADVASAQIGHPLIFQVLGWTLAHLHFGHAASVPLSLTQFHPIAFAAWIGILATSLNLLPGGQLDGGHLVYALKPSAHRIVTKLAMYALIPMAFFCWTGWLIWVFGLLITRNHPPAAVNPALPKNRRPLAWIALAMFILTLVPSPFPGGSIYEILQLTLFS